MTAAIEVNGLSKRFGDVQAVDDLSFAVAAGRVTGFLGPNGQAARGRAVLVSSHLLSEVAQSVDDVVVIARGALRASGPLERVLGDDGDSVTRVRAADPDALAAVLRRAASRRSATAGTRCWRAAPTRRSSARWPPSTGWRSSSSVPCRARWRTPSSR